MIAVIRPSKAVGRVSAPPSKSMAHRLLICAGLSRGGSVVRGLALSKDIEATVDCLRALGAEIRLDGDTAYIKGADPRESAAGSAELDCNESGSTLRFFAPLCMLGGGRHTLCGSEYLFTRPLSVYEDIAARQGIGFVRTTDSLIVDGKLNSGLYEVRGDISSQFISGLMFALPLLNGDSEIRLIPPVESKPYIDMTVSALRTFGVEIAEDGLSYHIKGGQEYKPSDVTVEGDYSNAAFFEALNHSGGQVKVSGLDEASLQGDKVYKILFEKIKQRRATGSDAIDISDCPDLGPILFAVSALCGGGEFIGTRRLRLKESDRIEAMRAELKKFGVTVKASDDSVSVSGELRAPDDVLFGHGDHRIVMSLAVVCTLTGGVIDGAEAVSKSFPDFFEKLKDLGVDIGYGMDQQI